MYYVIIPAYNPDQKLLELLEEIRHRLQCQVILVDDGSSASCQDIFDRASQYGILLRHSENMGKGQALRTAFQYLLDQSIDGVVVTADADGQHAIFDIDRVARAASNLPSHLILGVRQFSGKVPLRSRLGNELTKVLFKLQTGVSVSDTQTGLRGFQADMLPFMISIEGNRYEYEMNMLTLASRKYVLTEVPIQTIYLNNNASSHFRPIRDGLMIYKNLFKFALSSLGGFLIDYVVYALSLFALTFVPTSIRLLMANGLARAASSLCNYSLNKKLVFNNDDSIVSTGLGYFSLALLLFTFDTGLLYFLHSLLGVNLYLVKILVGLLLFFVSWFVQKHFIFRERKSFSHEVY